MKLACVVPGAVNLTLCLESWPSVGTDAVFSCTAATPERRCNYVLVADVSDESNPAEALSGEFRKWPCVFLVHNV